MPTAKITGLRIGNLEVSVDAQGATLKQVLESAGIHSTDGQTFVINGNRLADSEVAGARVAPGDTVRVHDANKGGRS